MTQHEFSTPPPEHNLPLTPTLLGIESPESQAGIHPAETGGLPEGQPFIPDGWTYLAHGTSKVEWRTTDLDAESEIVISGMGLSAITREMAEEDAKRYTGNSSTTSGYAAHRRRPEGMSEEEFAHLSVPFEMRILFYPEDASARFKTERWQALPPETRENINHYYYKNHQHGRHPLIPRGETLLPLSKDTAEDGHSIYYYLPGSIRNDYMAALASEQD